MGTWPPEEKTKLLEDMKVLPNFITDQEEDSIFKEVEPYLKRLHYESDHWDDVSIKSLFLCLLKKTIYFHRQSMASGKPRENNGFQTTGRS